MESINTLFLVIARCFYTGTITIAKQARNIACSLYAYHPTDEELVTVSAQSEPG